MDKNTIIGFVLIAAILIGYSVYSQPSDEEIAQQIELAKRDSIEAAKRIAAEKMKEKKELNNQKENLKDSTQLFFSALTGSAKDIILKNNKIELTVSTKGGTVNKAIIKNFTGHNIGKEDSNSVTLFEGKD